MTKKSRDRRKARRKEHMETWGYIYAGLRRVKPFDFARHNARMTQVVHELDEAIQEAQLMQECKLPRQSLKEANKGCN